MFHSSFENRLIGSPFKGLICERELSDRFDAISAEYQELVNDMNVIHVEFAASNRPCSAKKFAQ